MAPNRRKYILAAATIIAVVLIATAAWLPIFLSPYSAGKNHRVIRAVSNMRTVATALQTYHIDNSTYPLSEPLIPAMTTPVAYLNQMYEDSTAPKTSPPLHLRYYGSRHSFLLYGHGPDKDIDIIPHPDLLRPNDFAPLIPLTYDATNGATSNGDIWRKGNPSDI